MTRAYRLVRRFIRGLLELFFRRVEVTGLEHVPEDRGGLVVSWHPNGLIDPGLMLACFPRTIVFGARHGLFKWPLLGPLMRAIGTVPIYRASDASSGDEAARRQANRRSLDQLAGAIAAGSYSALFPEGLSHDVPHLTELKVGAARLYYRAHELSEGERPLPVILPVGLHYDDKAAFRSKALVTYHPPLTLPPDLAECPEGLPEEEARRRVGALTDAIRDALHDVVHATESWELHRTMHRTRRLMRAERAARAGTRLRAPDMQERQLGYERVWRGYYAQRERDPGGTQALLTRVEEYDAALSRLGLEDEELDAPPALAAPLLPALLVLQVVLTYLLLPPLLIFGYVLCGLPYFTIKALARFGAPKTKDRASIKVLAAIVLYPLTWAAAAWLAHAGALELHRYFPNFPASPAAAALATVALAAVGGLVALVYAELAQDTLRSLRVRFSRAWYSGAVAELRGERSRLFDAIEAMSAGLELPGQVDPDGRLVQQ